MVGEGTYDRAPTAGDGRPRKRETPVKEHQLQSLMRCMILLAGGGGCRFTSICAKVLCLMIRGCPWQLWGRAVWAAACLDVVHRRSASAAGLSAYLAATSAGWLSRRGNSLMAGSNVLRCLPVPAVASAA